MSKPRKTKPQPLKSRNGIIAQIEASQENEQSSNDENYVSFTTTMIILWPLLGALVFIFCGLIYDWKMESAAVIIRFGICWITFGFPFFLLGKLISKALSSSQLYRKLNGTVKGLPLTANRWDKKYPSFPWAGIAGTLLIIVLLCEHWNGVSHLFSSTNNSAPASTSNPNEGYMTRADDERWTRLEIAKGYNRSISKDDQDFLNAVESGKRGKPYGDRPDKDQDGQEP